MNVISLISFHVCFFKEETSSGLVGRWWYVLPDWPPADFDYVGALAQKGYRVVPLSEFEEAPDLDGNLRRRTNVFVFPFQVASNF